jgi:hypothetical protein
LAYRLLMVLLGGAHGRVVLRPGQLLGQDFSLVMAGDLAVAPVFLMGPRRIQQVVDGASSGAATMPAAHGLK